MSENINNTDSKEAIRGLVILCTAAFIVPFMGSAVNLALPQISKDFSMKAVTLTWIATAYLIATAIFQIPFARMADIIGRKKTFMMGVIIFTLCSALCGVAVSGEMLIILRLFSGVGSAMIFGTSIAILTSLFPPEKRGWALGINAAVVYGALAVGPFAGGIMTHYMSWRSIFFVAAAIGITVFILVHLFIKSEWVVAKGQKFDYIGSVLYGIGLSGIIYGFSKLPHVSGVIFIIVGFIAFVAFYIYEDRVSSPVFNLQLFRGNQVFTLSTLSTLINYMANSAVAFMLSLYLQYVRGLEASHAGFILISQACVQSVFSLVAGNLSKRYELTKLATLGMAISVIGLAGLSIITEHTHYAVIIGILVLLGVGFGIFSSPNTNVIMSSVDNKSYSQASAMTGTMRLTGQTLSMSIAGMAISLMVGNKNISPDLHPAFMSAMRLTFIISLCLCLIGVYASSVRIKGHKKL